MIITNSFLVLVVAHTAHMQTHTSQNALRDVMWPSFNQQSGGDSFDSMMNDLDNRLGPDKHQPSPSSFAGSVSDSTGAVNGPQMFMEDMKEAANSSNVLLTELRDLHKEASLAQDDLAKVSHLDAAEQRVMLAEREEASRNERLASNVAAWLAKSQAVLVESTDKLATLEQNLTIAALSMVLLLFLLAVFIIARGPPTAPVNFKVDRPSRRPGSKPVPPPPSMKHAAAAHHQIGTPSAGTESAYDSSDSSGEAVD